MRVSERERERERENCQHGALSIIAKGPAGRSLSLFEGSTHKIGYTNGPQLGENDLLLDGYL